MQASRNESDTRHRECALTAVAIAISALALLLPTASTAHEIWLYGDGNAYHVALAAQANPEATFPYTIVDKTRHTPEHVAAGTDTHVATQMMASLTEDIAEAGGPPKYVVIGYHGGSLALLACLFEYTEIPPEYAGPELAATIEVLEYLSGLGVKTYLTEQAGLPSWAGIPDPLFETGGGAGLTRECGETMVESFSSQLPTDEYPTMDWSMQRTDATLFEDDHHHISLKAGLIIARRMAGRILLDSLQD